MKIGMMLVGYKGILFLRKTPVMPEFVISYKDPGTSDEHYEAIKERCARSKIAFYSRTKCPESAFNNVDKIIVVGWQYIIKEYLDKTIIMHDSYLPELRGWCPTPTALIKGFDHLGATAFQPTAEVDWGKIYCQRRYVIQYPMKLRDAIAATNSMYCDMIDEIVSAHREPGAFPKGKSTYSIWRDKEDMEIDWNTAAKGIVRKVDALGFPLSGATTLFNGESISILDAAITEEKAHVDRHPGKIISIQNSVPDVMCAIGIVRILKAVKSESREPVRFTKLKQRLG